MERESKEVSNMKVINLLKRYSIITWLIFIAIWQFASLFYTKSFLPGPLETLSGAKDILLDGTLLRFVGVSILRVLKGWTISMCIGIPFGILIGKNKTSKQLFEPFVNFFRFIPAISLLTMFLMWFGVGEQSKVAIIIYASCFTIIVNTVTGVVSVEQQRIQAARSLGANELQVTFSVIFPSAVPYIFNGVRLGLGSAYTAIVGAEMLASNEGIGYLIYTSRLYFRMDWVLTGVLVLGLMGFFSDKLLRCFGLHFLKRYGVQDQMIEDAGDSVKK